jgi:hypothetical protein
MGIGAVGQWVEMCGGAGMCCAGKEAEGGKNRKSGNFRSIYTGEFEACLTTVQTAQDREGLGLFGEGGNLLW